MKVLAVGAHPDDIELGCGATLLRHAEAGDDITMLVMTPGQRGPQGLTSRVQEQEDAAALLGARLVWGHCDDGSVPTGVEAVALIDAVVRRVEADVIYAHAPNDTHQDHAATSQAALSAGRRLERVLFYQSPSTTSFDPNVFVDVETAMSGKLAALRAHWSQVTQCPMVNLEEVEVSARYWGSRAKLCYAEAFESPRFVWDIGARTASGAGRVEAEDGERASLSAVPR